MAGLRFIGLAYKLRRGWARIPPKQRRQLARNAQKLAAKHGPTIAKGVRKAVRQARKAR
jgi:hypothetical protein